MPPLLPLIRPLPLLAPLLMPLLLPMPPLLLPPKAHRRLKALPPLPSRRSSKTLFTA
jgi:hypothetical protein